jgi:hypothetical protein
MNPSAEYKLLSGPPASVGPQINAEAMKGNWRPILMSTVATQGAGVQLFIILEHKLGE